MVSVRTTIIGVVVTTLIPGLLIAGPPPSTDAVGLSTEEIRTVFADVRDDAELQDGSGTLAVNYWYADGTFSNRWTNKSGSGEVAGTWWAEADKRCVLIASGLPSLEGSVRCSPIYRRGETYLSVEPDGSIHGVHRLSVIEPAR